jgi:hypothetical protein
MAAPLEALKNDLLFGLGDGPRPSHHNFGPSVIRTTARKGWLQKGIFLLEYAESLE